MFWLAVAGGVFLAWLVLVFLFVWILEPQQ